MVDKIIKGFPFEWEAVTIVTDEVEKIKKNNVDKLRCFMRINNQN